MITLCYAAKGGSGTTVVACVRALGAPGPILLVDIDGDIPAMLGLGDPEQPGLLDWLESDAPMAHLDDLLIDATPNCSVLPATNHGPSSRAVDLVAVESARWDDLVDWFDGWCADSGGSVIIDAGTQLLPDSLLEQCGRRWLVTRACYLGLRRASRHRGNPTGVVLIDEPGHALRARDVETTLRAPIVATIQWDVSVTRAVDGGLLLGNRLPRSVHRALGRVAA